MADLENQNQPYSQNNNYPNYGANENTGYDYGSSKGLLGHDTRMKFITKVYSILSVQIGITCAMCFIAIENSGFNSFLKDSSNLWLFYVSIVMTLILCIMIVCYRKFAREVPTNYICLFLFTLFESYIVAQICVLYSPRIVIMAALLTMAMFIALTVYAFTTKTDFTVMGGLLFVCLFVFSLAGLFLLFTNNNVAHIIYCCFGVIIFSIYIIYDTQLLMDNKTYSYEIDDYIIASLQLYLDIINIFLYILEILGRSD
ncbi:inhibitor of apoptosis-promoting Bax1 protein (macronuclear) [Tetrahymena thermophila SB210]|uniref:Inhibitor of apoptosis-promoting Bax1 protein n=1 Tax=Tetrahymena thermophila (strain SB210) TaxID=312017 RepID=Q23U15_TETTS|nr:inhibitor of apoptosis-promoting Bax1 protein [Tetrahymena thermophila SB210]EAS00034.1 inhibitor of apoptosis-promoting Bax1 protein [Tetrahymena thermophila SB210]|eukprot:XP_001020280.1 inhibitor of apoptosis-promoting Bax1 protein [Tetrahymena thermophila SB210]